MKSRQTVFGIIVLATGMFVGAGGSALATVVTWQGGDGDWFTAANWNPNVVPCNAGPDPDNYDVTIDLGGVNVSLSTNCTVDSLSLQNGAALNVSAGADLTVATGTGLLIEGTVTVVGNVTIDVSAGPVTIGPKGVYQPAASATGAEASALLAGSITILKGLGGDPAGTMILDHAMTVDCAGDFVMDGLGAEPCTASPARGGATPPHFTGIAASRLTVGSDFSLLGGLAASKLTVTSDFRLLGSVDVELGSSGGMRGTPNNIELGGDFDNQSTTPECFDAINGSMLLNGLSQTYEVAGVIRSISRDGLAENLVNNFAFGSITVSGTSTVTFQDLTANAGSGVQESLFVDGLTLEAGAAINVNDSNVYYNAVVADGVSVSYGGNGHLAPVESLLVATASQWGMILFTLLLLTAGTVVVGRPRRATA